MILVFDLDDTLYPEIDYVKSGIYTVAKYLSEKYNLDAKEINIEMFTDLKLNGRGLIFNNILHNYNIYSKKELNNCVSVYRKHKPKIVLYEAAEKFLDSHQYFNKYIITDGNINVQRNKIKALGLKKYFKKTIPTYQYGINHSKPSTLCFEKIMKWENCEASDLIYIGDNPNKDFVNIKKIGIRTIRVLTGGFKEILLENHFEAEITIKSLDQLNINLINELKNENK
jgi:putative hydrolase of the HAD superfamily